MKPDTSTVVASLSWDVEMEKKHTVVQVSHDIVQRCDMVAVKHSKWSPESLQIFVMPSALHPEQITTVRFNFVCKGGKSGWRKRIPSIAIRSTWWDELSALVDPPRNGTIAWSIVDGEGAKTTAMDTFAELDRALGGK